MGVHSREGFLVGYVGYDDTAYNSSDLRMNNYYHYYDFYVYYHGSHL